jgi:hypothetical protein
MAHAHRWTILILFNLGTPYILCLYESWLPWRKSVFVSVEQTGNACKLPFVKPSGQIVLLDSLCIDRVSWCACFFAFIRDTGLV